MKIGFPEVSGKYKVVQLELKGKSPSLVTRFQKPRELFSFNVLENLLSELKLPFQTRKSYDGIQVPELESESYRVRGIGKCEVDFIARRLEFFGLSSTYEITLDSQHIVESNGDFIDWNPVFNPDRYI